MNILYVEDNAQDAAMAEYELKRAGGAVTVARTLAEARAVLLSGVEYDVMLADLNLPDGSGLELVTEVRQKNLPWAVVILTGSGDERSAVAALKAGADDYLVKQGTYTRELATVLESSVAAFRAGEAKRARPLRVLYAEHNGMDVDITRRHLARHAAHIRMEEVREGKAVLARLDRGEDDFDVLLLDYRLVGLNGLELLDELAKRPGFVLPVVVVTGQGDEETAVEAIRRGASDYLVKRPGYLHELAGALENAHHRALLAREQAALRASEERFRQLADHISEVFWITDVAKAEMIYVSPGYERIWGRPGASLLANPAAWMEAVHPEDRPLVAGDLGARQAAGGYDQTYRILRPDGETRWVRDRAWPVKNGVGVIYRVVGVAEDVTEQKGMEEQFRQAQKMEAMGMLSGGIAHDFNNLLTIIHGHLGLIQAAGGMPSGLVDSIDQITEAATRATNLTRQLLTFSRKQVMQSRELDLCGVVETLTKMLKRVIGVEVEMKLKHPGHALWVWADAGMVEQVLLNLTINARDAMPRGGRLSIELAEVGEEVCLTVEDTGTGTPAELMGKIFDPFFTTKDVGKGTGLGLPTVYGIALQHKGRVEVESVVGQGTAFHFYLPRLGKVEEPKEVALEAASFPSGTETVLLVEDEAAVANLVKMTLELMGYRVLEAATGKAALGVWRLHRADIDLLLTDYMMPDGMTGLELAKAVLAEAPELPVIFTSGYSAELAGRDLGVVRGRRFLAKPFTCQSLLVAVREELDEVRKGSGAS